MRIPRTTILHSRRLPPLKSRRAAADQWPMKQFRCGDVVPGCSAVFKGSDEQILAAVAEHARRDHGMTEIPAALVARVRTLIHPAEAEPAATLA